MSAKQLITIAVTAMLLIGVGAAVGAASPADQANDNATDAHEAVPDDPRDDETDPIDDRADGADERADGADERAANSDERADSADRRGGNADERDDGNADGVGPSDGLPEQAPDHVSQIHETIESFLNGSVEDLGESLSELLSEGDSADVDDEGSADDEDAA